MVSTTGKRRSAVIATAVAGALVLAACGDSNEPDENAPAQGQASFDLDEVYDINEQPVENLQAGGEVTLPVGTLGPNFNLAAPDGYNIGNLGALHPIMNVRPFNNAPSGEPVLNTDYVLAAEEEILEDGTQVLHYELNPEAVWNDGTPIDFYTYEHTVNLSQPGSDEDIDPIGYDFFRRVGEMTMGEDEWSFSMKMAETMQPWEALFQNGMVHPAVDTAEEFNNGFVNDLRPEYRAGPYTVDVYDQAANVLSLVPNPNWWGDEPILDRINFVQHEPTSTIQAFQNREIDGVQIQTYDRYSEITGWSTEGYDIRRGQSLMHGGFIFNGDAPSVSDVEVRKAVFQATDRELLADIRFQGLNWEEEMPGSWLMMPFDHRYQDNFPVDFDPEAARTTLEEAGWTGEEGETRTNADGEPLTITLSTFGNDPSDATQAQSYQTMMRDVGIDVEIRNRGLAEAPEARSSRDFEVIAMSYGKSRLDPTSGPPHFWSTGTGNLSGVGDADLDEWIEALPEILDQDERIAEALAIEAEAMNYYTYLTYYNGADIWAYREGLANYGPRLFETVDWTIVGWEEDSDEDGTDSGVDIEDLDDDSGDEESGDD